MLNINEESAEENEKNDNDHEDEEDNNEKVDDDVVDFDNDELVVVQEMYEYNFVLPNKMLGMELTGKGTNGIWVSKVNIEEL